MRLPIVNGEVAKIGEIGSRFIVENFRHSYYYIITYFCCCSEKSIDLFIEINVLMELPALCMRMTIFKSPSKEI